MYKTKKATHPIVAVSLLLIVTVIAAVGFQDWFSSFSTEVLMDTEQQSAQANQGLKVETLVGNK